MYFEPAPSIASLDNNNFKHSDASSHVGSQDKSNSSPFLSIPDFPMAAFPVVPLVVGSWSVDQ